MYKNTYNAKPTKGQKFNSLSKTIQGQTLSVADMLKRLQNGQPVTLRNLEYGGDEIPQPRIKDLTDIDDMQAYVNDMQAKVGEYKKAAEKQAEKIAKDQAAATVTTKDKMKTKLTPAQNESLNL